VGVRGSDTHARNDNSFFHQIFYLKMFDFPGLPIYYPVIPILNQR
jgi:hypothetical protein